MHDALVGTRAALAPGGALVFFFADPERPAEGAGLEILEWDRAHLAPHALEWDHPADDGSSVTHLRIASSAERHIDEHHVWVTRDARGELGLEATMLRRIYSWDWHAMSGALERAGYEAPIGRHFVNDKGHRSALCLAHRQR
jgi:hypothetical protein